MGPAFIQRGQNTPGAETPREELSCSGRIGVAARGDSVCRGSGGVRAQCLQELKGTARGCTVWEQAKWPERNVGGRARYNGLLGPRKRFGFTLGSRGPRNGF